MRWLNSLWLLAGLACSLVGKSTLAEAKIDITCDPMDDNQIDWDCIFGPDSLAEVNKKGGYMTSCSPRDYACSRFVVKKNEERSETKVNEGPEGFDFNKGETYTIKYSFKAREGMKVSKKYTHLGQLKGTIGKGKVKGVMIKGDPIYSLTANNHGIMVRFSNRDSTDNFHEGLKKHLSWSDSTGQWVHVKIQTTFGKSMVVTLSGAVEGKAEWPSNLKPVAWHASADRVRMKLGLYHKVNEVYDGQVEYRDISIKGPNGIITTARDTDKAGYMYLGCFEDERNRVFSGKRYVDAHMTTKLCADLCDGAKYIGLQYGNECYCGKSTDKPERYGESKSCSTNCPGEHHIEKCGGYWAMDVYERDGKPDDIPKGTKYVGCFADEKKDRALTLKMKKSSKMDYDDCKKHCDSAGATYFALQYGEECFCGKSKDNYDEHGPAICHMQCPGDKSSICGGNFAMSVFRL